MDPARRDDHRTVSHFQQVNDQILLEVISRVSIGKRRRQHSLVELDSGGSWL
jgi:hypothetical protein